MTRPTLTASAIARNEEHDLPGWLDNTLRFCDEVIVVVDARTDDGTRGVLQRAQQQEGDRVRWIEKEMDPDEGFAGMRNASLDVARTDWVIHMDVDMRAPPGLGSEIRSVLGDGTKNGYRYRLLNHFLHHPVKGGGWSKWNKAWIGRRGAHRFANRIHEVTHVDGGEAAIGQLTDLMWHLNDADYVERVRKNLGYMQGSGRKIVERGIRVRWYHMVLHPGWRAFKTFVLQGGWRDGTQGFLHAVYTFSSNFNWWAYAWDVQNRVERSELEGQLSEAWGDTVLTETERAAA